MTARVSLLMPAIDGLPILALLLVAIIVVVRRNHPITALLSERCKMCLASNSRLLVRLRFQSDLSVAHQSNGLRDQQC